MRHYFGSMQRISNFDVWLWKYTSTKNNEKVKGLEFKHLSDNRLFLKEMKKKWIIKAKAFNISMMIYNIFYETLNVTSDVQILS